MDTQLQVGQRMVRVLRVEGRQRDDAEPQLLIHGLGASSVTWIEVVHGLAEFGPVVAVDLPGFGRTPHAEGDSFTVPSYVRFLADVADALRWDSFALHGNSMGGLVATIFAGQHPERVRRLVLVSPALPPRFPLRLLLPSRATIDGMLPIAVSSLAAAALGLVGLAGPTLSERRNRDLLKLIYPDPDGINRSVLDLMAADFADDDDVGATRRRQALLTAVASIARIWADPRGIWRAINRVTAPTLLVGGTQDALVPASTLRSVLTSRPDWQGHVLDDRRHALMLEEPQLYLELVSGWRSGTARAA
jgi:pimeloyl-ACP methyl ester carboxylesterase